MTKLYYTPTSCGAASFITAHIAGTKLDLELVDIPTHKTASGADFYNINPKGNVPALILDDGTLLNEGAAVLQWIADQNPGTIAPANGTIERYLVINALNYVASEAHPAMGINFYPPANDAEKEARHAKLNTKFKYLNEHALNGKNYLANDTLSIADIYLYIVLSWAGFLGISFADYANVTAFFERVANHEKVKPALELLATNPSSI